MINLSLIGTKAVNSAIQEMHFHCDQKFDYHAGQYLELQIPGQKDLYFTIASSPLESDLILLVENRMAKLIAEYCQKNTTIATHAAAGLCHIDQFEHEFEHLILVAAGSGFSQMRAICQEVMLRPISKRVSFIWGNDSVFSESLINTWQSRIEVKLPHIDDNSQKHQALLEFCQQQRWDNLQQSAVIACGSPSMVYPLFDYVTEQGLTRGNMLADVFQFMPREES